MKTTKKETKTIRNLAEYLAMLSADTPYQAGRYLYKYTDCGPWTVFLKETAPAHTRTAVFAVGIKDKHLAIVYREEGMISDDTLNDSDIRRMGFGPNRKCEVAKSLKQYRSMVEAFIARTKSNDRWTVKLHDTHPHSGEPDPRRVWLTISEDLPAATEDIYYESKEANEDIPRCVGIKIGSIVEGSDVEIDRDYLMFPFTWDEFDALVKGINDEASFYWNRDNLDDYHVLHNGKDFYFSFDGIESLKGLPKSIRGKVAEFINSDAGSLMSGSCNDPDGDGGMTPIPGTKATIEQMDKSFLVY